MRRSRLAVIGMVLVVLAGALAAYLAFGSGTTKQAGPGVRSARVPGPRPPVLAAIAESAPDPSTGPLSAVLRSRLADPALGGVVSAVVLDATTGRVVYDRDGTTLVPPASTAKLATAVATLSTLGPAYRVQTRTYLDGGAVVLVGGGDPTLAGPHDKRRYPVLARLSTLAADTAKALAAKGVHRVRLVLDSTLFTGPSTGPAWRTSYVTEGDVAPVSALEVDEDRYSPTERPRYPSPTTAAGAEFARLLAADGVTVVGTPTRGRRPDGASQLAFVSSPPLPALVERMLTDSDNDLAEALARLLALHDGLPGTFAAGASAVHDALGKLGLDVAGLHLVDGSGLSRDDRVRPQLLAQLVAIAASPAHPELRAVVTGMPIAAFTGTLADRYKHRPASSGAGIVRAKTGTLAGVSSLAGLVQDADGRLLAFAVVASHAPGPDAAEAALDRVAAALAGCGCR